MQGPCPDADDETWEQLALRHHLTAQAACSDREAAFVVLVQDDIQGDHLPAMVQAAGEPVHVTVVDTTPETIA